MTNTLLQSTIMDMSISYDDAYKSKQERTMDSLQVYVGMYCSSRNNCCLNSTNETISHKSQGKSSSFVYLC